MDSPNPTTTAELSASHGSGDSAGSVSRAAALAQRIAELARGKQRSPSASSQRAPRTTLQLSELAAAAAADPPNRQQRRWSYRRSAPTWLISAVIHALLITTLALLTTHHALAPRPLIIAHHQVPTEKVTLIQSTVVPAADRDLGRQEKVGETAAAVMLVSAMSDLRDALATHTFSATLTPSAMRGQQLDAVQRVTREEKPQAKKGRGAQFYGIEAPGNRFVFIVDSSMSMRLKFADAKRELERAVRGLDQEQLFYVIFFDQDEERLRLGKWNRSGSRFALENQSEPDLVPASEANIQSLVYWMATIQLGSQTNPHTAVAYALRKLQPDAIFLLSDGEFTDGGATESLLSRENLLDDPTHGVKPKTVVHCVGFYSRVGEVALQRIARDNGGTYRFVGPTGGLLVRPAAGPAGPRVF